MTSRGEGIGTLCVGILCGVIALAGTSGRAQITPPPAAPTFPNNGHADPHHPPPDSPFEAVYAEKQAQQREIERQRRLEKDTERLLMLATQLRAEVAASGTETMTPEMVRKMDEIEKLARSVKEKMRN